MHEISWLVVVFYSIPECFFVAWLGLLLINIRPSLARLAYVSLAYSPFVYVIRRLSLPYGLHTIILTTIIIVLIFFFLKIPIMKAAIGVITGVIVSLSLETLSIPLIAEILNISFAQIINDPYMSIIISLPKLLIMLAICILIKKNKFHVIDLEC